MSRYYTRSNGKIAGPYTVEQLEERLAAGTLAPDSEALEAWGQSAYALTQTTDWVPIHPIVARALSGEGGPRLPKLPSYLLHSPYRPCRACKSFMVVRDEASCPYCGAVVPHPRPSEPTLARARKEYFKERWRATRCQFAVVSVVGALLISGLVIACTAETNPALRALWILMALLASTGVAAVTWGAVLGGAGDEWLLQKRSAARLRDSERTMRERLSQIETRRAEVDRVLARVAGEPRQERWGKTRMALERAATALARQQRRYRAQLADIRLVVWRNELEPLAYGVDRAGIDELDQRAAACASIEAKGRELLQEVEAAGEEGAACAGRVREALATADTLRQELVARQAVVALQGVAPLDEVVSQPVLPANQPDLLDARVRAISEIAASVGDLEAEYQRLVAEEGLAQTIEAR